MDALHSGGSEEPRYLSPYTFHREGAVHLIDSGTPSLEERLFIPLVAVLFSSRRGVRFVSSGTPSYWKSCTFYLVVKFLFVVMTHLLPLYCQVSLGEEQSKMHALF